MKYARDLWRLRGVEVLDPVVDAGDEARLRLHLVPEDGPEVTRVVEVAMPEELAGKDVDVDVVPGYDVAPELPAPESLDELLANEPQQTVAPRAVVVQFRVPSQGIAYRGHVTQRLPAFTLDALRPQSSDTGPDDVPELVAHRRAARPLRRGPRQGEDQGSKRLALRLVDVRLVCVADPRVVPIGCSASTLTRPL